MDKMKLLIAVGNEEFRRALADALRGACQVRQCAEGNQARELLVSFRPDVLVLDLMLPGLDGISLLRWAEGEGLRTRVLATTRFASDYILQQLSQLGVGYLMLEPCDLGAVVGHIRALGAGARPRPTAGTDPRSQVSNLLLALGIPTKLRGYGYLREAVLLMVEKPTQSITKELYPEVARICGCAPAHVERSIRSAVEAAWERRDERLWRMYFPQDRSGNIPRPSNGTFVTRLAESLRGQLQEIAI